MSKKIQFIFHVGYHKCASTLLQRAVFCNLEGVYNFKKWGKESHAASREYLDKLQGQGFDKKFFVDFISKLIPESVDKVLISHEELSGHLLGYKSVDPFKVCQNLKELSNDAKVVFIIRNQLDWLKSIYSYRTSIKGHEIRSFSKFLKDESKNGLIDKLKYEILIKKYIEAFGKENILVLPLEMLRNNQKEFMSNLSSFIGSDIGLAKQQTVNSSTSLTRVINICRGFNFLFLLVFPLIKLLPKKSEVALRYRFYDFKRYFLTPILNKIFGRSKKLELEGESMVELLKVYKKSNSKLKDLLDLDLSPYGY